MKGEDDGVRVRKSEPTDKRKERRKEGSDKRRTRRKIPTSTGFFNSVVV